MISVFISSALQDIALKETGQQVSDFPFLLLNILSIPRPSGKVLPFGEF